MISLRVLVTCTAICLFGSLGASAAIVYSEDWDNPGDGVAGWVQNTVVTTVVHQPVGGNPGGYLGSSGTGAGTFDIGGTTELAAASGDWAAAGIGLVSFDVLFTEGDFDDAWFRVRFQDATFDGWSYSLTNAFGLGVWNTYSIAFDPTWSDAQAMGNGWLPDDVVFAGAIAPPSFATTMSDVYHPEVRLSGEGLLVGGIDNFVLQTPIPEPATMTLMGLGLAGLAYRRRKSA